MKKQTEKTSVPNGHRLIRLLSLLLLIIAGLWAANESERRADQRMRSLLIQDVITIATTIEPDEIQALSFTESDRELPAFKRITRQLQAYAEATGQQNIYTLALRDDHLVFGPESIATNSPLASSPGTVYQDPSALDFKIFETGEAMTQGPVRDEYGSFVTATAPLFHRNSGETLCTIGIDIKSSVWKQQTQQARKRPLLIALIPCLLLIFGEICIQIKKKTYRTKKSRMRYAIPAHGALILLLLTAFTTVLFYQAEKASRKKSFHSMSLLKAGIYEEEFKRLEDSIQMMAMFFNASEFVSHEEFSTFTQPLITGHPISRCLWFPEINTSDIPAFEQQVQTHFSTNYIVRPPRDALNSTAQDKAYPALYVEPLARQNRVPGLNLYSKPICRDAIDEALRSGYATASGSTKLTQRPDAPLGMYIFYPVSTEQTTGVLAIAIRPEKLIRQLEKRTITEMSGITANLMELHQGEEPHQLTHLRRHPHHRTWEMKTAGLHKVVPLFAFGKTYALLIRPTPLWFQTYPLHNWRIALFAGLVLSILLTGLIAMLTNRPILLEKLVQLRTKELERSKKSFKTMIDTLPLAIYLSSGLEQTGEYMNPAFTKLLGYTLADCPTAAHWFNLSYPDATYRNQLEQEWTQKIKLAIQTRSHIEPIETVVTCKDGSQKNILWGYMTTGEKNYAYGLDLTKRHQAEEKMIAYTQELERFNHASVGRELRMIELKKEINILSEKLNQPAPYPLQFQPDLPEETA